MPKLYNIKNKKRLRMVFPAKRVTTCKCDDTELPPWTGEMHGLSQALLSKTFKMKVFWWFVMVVCITSGTTTTVMVIIEYLQGPTATSTTIRLVGSLELPAITVCPKVPDAYNALALLADIQHVIHGLSNDEALDLVRFWIGGYGLENMDNLMNFNTSYLKKLDDYYTRWSRGYSVDQFFRIMNEKYGYRCDDLFYDCELGGNTYDCCNDLFVKKIIMRRGTCYTTRRGVNQTEADDMGRLILHLKAPSSITSPKTNYIQSQIIIYVTDNYEYIPDFPRFYLYPQEWNRMRFTARFLELLEQEKVCTNKIFGKDAECIIRRWLLSNIVYPYNCSLLYLNISKVPLTQSCDPYALVSDYYNAIQLVWTSATVKEECIPGCKRWDNQISLQQTKTLQPFEGYTFNLEASFNDLQYEYVKEVYTISVPGFMSQIGGQFGFFLGLSIITFLQMTLYAIHYCLKLFYKKTHRYIRSISEIRSRAGSVHPRNSFAVNAISPTFAGGERRFSEYAPRRQSVIQISGRLIDENGDDKILRERRHTVAVIETEKHDANRSASSIHQIDAVTLPDVTALTRDTDSDDSLRCKKCSLSKVSKKNKKLRKGGVTFAYRTTARWTDRFHRTVSDGWQTAASSEVPNAETSFSTFPRANALQNNFLLELEEKISNSDEKIADVISLTPQDL